MAELCFAFVTLACAIAVLLCAARRSGPSRFAVAGIVAVAVVPGVVRLQPTQTERARNPRVTNDSAYVSSAACKSCHPSEYASWYRTYHRTMTQAADARILRAPLDTALRLDGLNYGLIRRGNEVWATLPDPDASVDVEGLGSSRAGVTMVERQLILTTGSHHYEGYWIAGRRPGELRMFPFVYVMPEKRWFSRRDVFLQPPLRPQKAVCWNSNCIQCHATAGRPGLDLPSDRFDTQVAELGIACEACHGAGGQHVLRHRDPMERYAAYGSDSADPSIVNPARLPADRASMVCGQCHAYTFPKDEEEWWTRGYTQSFVPGQDLSIARVLLTSLSLDQPGSPNVDTKLDSMFWPDGTVRVGGREYNGLVASACFQKGVGRRRLSCSSCHSMHASDPDDQLAEGHDGNFACLTCHGNMKDGLVEHTHHGATSSGSLCVSCHMPKTAYALLKTIRSHRIDSPSIRSAESNGRPPACNLCHLDRSLMWTQGWLREWYGVPHENLRSEEDTRPAAVAWLLRGDAGQRVVVAAAMGSTEAHDASGTGWEAPVLAQALEDPYAAVRIVAYRSLRTLPGFGTFEYDPVGTREERARAQETVVERWERSTGRPFNRAAIHGYIAQRDEREITISE